LSTVLSPVAPGRAAAEQYDRGCALTLADAFVLAEFTASAVTAMSSRMSAGEWQTRCDLATSYRLIDLFGWSDLLGTHISARVPARGSFVAQSLSLRINRLPLHPVG
jgi:hypothetical protein